MKIREAIALLETYEDKNLDIVIGWWDKETVEQYVSSDFTLTEVQWQAINREVGDNPIGFAYVGEELEEHASQYSENPIHV